ncbi:hypothetical protein B4U79_03227, partial [Dinothrombium tinctorium]
MRCYASCRRSEDDIGCRRCRFREPLRFGKRDFDQEKTISTENFLPYRGAFKIPHLPFVFKPPKYVYNVPFYGK